MRDDLSRPVTELQRALKHEAENKERTQLFINASLLAILLMLYEFFNPLYVRVYWLAAYTRFTGKITLDVAAATGYFNETAPEITETTAFNMTGSVFIVAFSSLSVFLVGQFIMKIPLHEVIRPYKKAFTDGVSFLPTAMTFNLMAGILVNFLTDRLRQEGVTLPESDFSVRSPSTYALVIQFLYICVIGPICEEFIYRGLCIKLLSPYGSGLAIAFSGVTFGLIHGNIKQAVPAMLTGALYAMIAIRFGSIVPTIIIHIINNIIASISDYGSVLGFQSDNIIRVINVFMLFFGFYGAIVLFTELLEKTYTNEPKCENSMARRFRTVGTNIFCLIYLFYLMWELIEKIIKANK